MNFDKYKSRLKDYLQQKGVDLSVTPTHCFNARDHKNGDQRPSCQVFDENFKCYGCGISGDIYDAVGILEGIADRKEQYLFVERLFGGSQQNLSSYTSAENYRKSDFAPDRASCEKLEAFLKKNPGSQKMIRAFLKERAVVSTKNAAQDYPEDMLDFLAASFFYWPGFQEVEYDLGRDILKRCGIPLVNPGTGHSTWEHSGVVVKLGTGYKLHYYETYYCNKCKVSVCASKTEGGSCKKCEKRTSKCGKTFPMPGEIDNTKPVILVEGEMDALSCAACGIKNVFSTGGSSGLTGPKIDAFLLDVPEIIVFFDADIYGKKAAGLDTTTAEGKARKNIPALIESRGFRGKIKIAELPVDNAQKDQDGFIVSGRRDVVLAAIEAAKDYVRQEVPPPKTTGKESFTISFETLCSLLKKIKRTSLEASEREPFVAACLKACGDDDKVKTELINWGAAFSELDARIDVDPDFIIKASQKHGTSKELNFRYDALKRLNIKLDYEKLSKDKNVQEFLEFGKTHAAAEVMREILGNNVVYVKSGRRFYCFNGHVWYYEPDITSMIYEALGNIVKYCSSLNIYDDAKMSKRFGAISSFRWNVEVENKIALYYEVHKEDLSFDSADIKETITLADGVLDFSGRKIVFRKSRREEFRKDILPYSVQDIKTASNHKEFDAFMKSNFKNEETLQSLLYYLSLIPSRNTGFKYGGIFVGRTNTGKTTTLEVVRSMFPSMFTVIPAEILAVYGKRRGTSGNEATPYLASLEGKGVGVASESEAGAMLNNALFKQLTGGDMMTARNLYEKEHHFLPTAQIIISTNNSPRFDAKDAATVGRLVIIPFSVSHERGAEGTKDKDDIIKSLRPEFPAIIKMLAEYYIKLRDEYAHIIPLSAECQNYKNNYVDEQRTDLDKFVSDNIETGLGAECFEKSEDLYARFLQYYSLSEEEAEREVISRRKFSYLLRRDFLELKNYKKKKIDGKVVPVFLCIKLKPWNEDMDGENPQGIFDNHSASAATNSMEDKNAQDADEGSPYA